MQQPLKVYTGSTMKLVRSNALIRVGRPSVMDDGTVAEICQVLKRGFSIQAACNYAQIDRSTFYRNLRKNPIFATKVATSIMFLTLASTEVVYKEVVYKKSLRAAMWYLERTDPKITQPKK